MSFNPLNAIEQFIIQRLNSKMVRGLLKLIFSESENTGGAQIIFTTHNPLFLEGHLLRRENAVK